MKTEKCCFMNKSKSTFLLKPREQCTKVATCLWDALCYSERNSQFKQKEMQTSEDWRLQFHCIPLKTQVFINSKIMKHLSRTREQLRTKCIHWRILIALSAIVVQNLLLSSPLINNTPCPCILSFIILLVEHFI